MKLNSNAQLLTLLLIAIFFYTQSLQAQVIKIQAEDAYTYPIKPRTEEWKALPNYQARVKACKIPAEILKGMSTKGVLKATLEHPFGNCIWLYNTTRDGYSATKGGNDALQELVQRKDAPKLLTDLYVSLDADAFEEDWDGIMRATYSSQTRLIENILLDWDVFTQLSVEDKKALAQSCLEKLLVMQTIPKIYGAKTISETAGFGGRLLLSLQYEPFKKLMQSTNYSMDFLERNFSHTTLATQTIALLQEFSKKKSPLKKENLNDY